MNQEFRDQSCLENDQIARHLMRGAMARRAALITGDIEWRTAL
jgi:hypothetical protein